MAIIDMNASLDVLHRALVARDRSRINHALTALLAIEAPRRDRWRVFADVLAKNGEVTLALRAIDHYVAVDPRDAARQFANAVLTARVGHLEKAAGIARDLLLEHPDNPQYNHFMGALASQMGDFVLAVGHFRAVVDRYPRAGQTWLELSAIYDFRDDAGLLRRLQRAADESARLAPEMRGPMLFALGKALDDIDDVDGAFAAFALGAAQIAETRPYDSAADDANAGLTVRSWTLAVLESLTRSVQSADAPMIFVSGLPRSGTTLVEQMLASNAAVADGGETGLFSLVAGDIGGSTPQAVSVFVGAGGDLAGQAELYRHLLAERFGADRTVVDKSLGLSRLLGLVVAILPTARIIWLRREPIDAAWSCFRTHFASGVDWSWRLPDIAHHFALEDRVFRHWRDTLGERFLTVPYEELATSPERWGPRIEAHCGLTHDPASLTPHLTERPVLTSSVAQVRRPINRDAIGSAQRYRHHLAPFIEAYERLSAID